MENTTDKSTVISNKMNDANAFTAVVATIVYLYMFGIFCCYWAFLVPAAISPFPAPYSFETATVASSVASGILVDVALLCAFIVPHSILARNRVKEMMALPKSLERPFFVLQTTIFMHCKMAFWQELDSNFVLWNIPKPYSSIVMAFFLFGFLFLFSCTFALDHFWLFGLSQGYGIDINKKIGLAATEDADGFVVRWHYALCAHPIMTGMMIGLWATPYMTPSHFLFSSVLTSWMVIAVKYLEEPQLEKMIGDKYTEYLREVPRYVPKCPFTGRSQGTPGKGGCPFSSSGSIPRPNDVFVDETKELKKQNIGGGYGSNKKYESSADY